MSILIDKVRIKNFRSLKDVEIDLQPITILVGANNAGKTTFLRALNAVLGTNRTAINKDDLFIDQLGNRPNEKEIIIDIRIVPVVEVAQRKATFESNEYGLFNGQGNVSTEIEGNYINFEFYAFRSIFKFNENLTFENLKFSAITNWIEEQTNETDVPITSIREGLNLFFLDAQRDLNDDIKQRTSFFGKQTAEIRESTELKAFEGKIDELNKEIVNESTVLKELSTELSKLNQTIQNSDYGVSIKPLNSRIRDLHKGMKVEYQDNGSASFGMEYHGMGTRSWASILSFGAYVNQEAIKRQDTQRAYLPILALEEPEAHLHPNAQRTLYQQLKNFRGQKIVSTHSPYIAGQAELEELRHFYKKSDSTEINLLNMDSLSSKEKLEYTRRIKREVIIQNGEPLFAKAILLFEGETESQVLNFFAEKYFTKPLNTFGISLVSANGGGYKPFLMLCKQLKIDWFILSDYDNTTVQSNIDNSLGLIQETVTSVAGFISLLNNSFEHYLIDNEYFEEVRSAVSKQKFDKFEDEPITAQKVSQEVMHYNISQLKEDCGSKKNKTKYATYIAKEIIESSKPIPPKIKELFDKIAQKLNIPIPTNETTTF